MSNISNNGNVMEMSESQFKDSLDALIAGELEDPNSRLTPLPSSESSACSSLAFTTEAVHQHEAQAVNQQQSAITQFQLQQSQQMNPSMSRITMNMMDGGQHHVYPSNGIASQYSSENALPGILSSGYSADLPSDSYASSETTASRQGSRKSRATSNKRKKDQFIGAQVSEDEGGRMLRKVERNAREQKRSQQIVDQISNLRDLLASSSVPTKADKYSTLVTAAKYIKQLQERSTLLENEQKKLLLTIGQATGLVNNKHISVASTAEPTESLSLDRSSSLTSTDEDESPVFVHGLDYRAVFLACPVAGAITSIDGRFLDCNEDFEAMTGYTKDELFRKPCDSTPLEPSERHMSVFNVLKREDMERLFVIMSDMLRKPASENQDAASIEGERREADRWSDQVALNRKENAHLQSGKKSSITGMLAATTGSCCSVTRNDDLLMMSGYACIRKRASKNVTPYSIEPRELSRTTYRCSSARLNVVLPCQPSCDDDFILGAYLPDYRDYIQVNHSAPFLTDLYLFSAAPADIMGDKQLDDCCLNENHYRTARHARAFKAEQQGQDSRNLRLWLTVGGAGRSDHFLHDLDGLVESIYRVIKREELHGVSLDCESFSHEDDYSTYQLWITRAANELKANGVSVTVTLHVGQYLSKDAYAAVDQLHLMAYDMHGAYHADIMAVSAAVDKLIESGCAASKIIVGVPAYARHSRRPGDVKSFAEIIDEIERSQSRDKFEDAGYWKGYRGESTFTVKTKVAWARKRELGGIFFWELGQDKQHPTAPGGLLLEAAATAVKETMPLSSDEL
ncbi:hypothetical protein MPSEU_000101200 [Mayamaea pseudoterrestris]|nr:hypothetical protein MPSEU_000101200 [Mayamaea pseudoterrestris]